MKKSRGETTWSKLGRASFRRRRYMPVASSSPMEEEDVDVDGSVEPAMLTQNSTFPQFFWVLTPFQIGSDEKIDGSRN